MTQEELKARFRYDPKTGIFTDMQYPDKQVGSSDGHGYLRISVDNKKYYLHRLAFLYMTGRFPKITDHINRKRDDNRWENLREVFSSKQNLANTELGKSRVRKKGKKYEVSYGKSRKTYLGVYETYEEAFEVYRKHKEKISLGLIDEQLLLI